MRDEGSTLARVRMAAARARLAEAKELLRAGYYGGAVNRSYYAIYTATRALLALKRLDSKSHEGALLLFQRHYVKTGLLPKYLADVAKAAKGMREGADYDDFVEISTVEARREYAAAAKFVGAVEKYVRARRTGGQ